MQRVVGPVVFFFSRGRLVNDGVETIHRTPAGAVKNNFLTLKECDVIEQRDFKTVFLTTGVNAFKRLRQNIVDYLWHFIRQSFTDRILSDTK